MRYKLIAMDMDGTLLNTQKEITPYTRQILDRAADMGVVLAVCTGRLFASGDFYARLLGREVPVVASNGAYIKDARTNKVIYEKKLDSRSVRNITSVIKSYGFSTNYYTTHHVIAEEPTIATVNYLKWNETMPECDRVAVDVGKSFEEIIEYYGNDIFKLVVNDEDSCRLKGLRKAIEDRFDVTVVSSWNDNIEVMSPGVSKGNSIRKLARHYGLEGQQVMCFGDNQNDISMIEYAGMGIAMGNATEELKRRADYITDTNDNDGVAKAIEKYVLEV